MRRDFGSRCLTVFAAGGVGEGLRRRLVRLLGRVLPAGSSSAPRGDDVPDGDTMVITVGRCPVRPRESTRHCILATSSVVISPSSSRASKAASSAPCTRSHGTNDTERRAAGENVLCDKKIVHSLTILIEQWNKLSIHYSSIPPCSDGMIFISMLSVSVTNAKCLRPLWPPPLDVRIDVIVTGMFRKW